MKRKPRSLPDVIGVRFSRLTVKAVWYGAPRNGHRHSICECDCDCGKTHVSRLCHLKSGMTTSCGCRRDEIATTHGGSVRGRNPSYAIWGAMRSRVSPGHACRRHYHDRGIRVCRRWSKFANFLADMGRRPAGMSLDRIDNDKGYSPSNCRWATTAQQLRNTRRNRILTAFGERKTVVEWAEDSRCNACEVTIHSRLRYGWDHERAIATPPLIKRVRK